MFTYIKQFAFAAALTGMLLGSGVAYAGGHEDATSKIRGDYSTAKPAARSQVRRPSRAWRPFVVRPQPAPRVIVAAPTERRAFSVEPAPVAEPAVQPRTTRSFSVEPSAPVIRSVRPNVDRSSPATRFLLPKTDPLKYSTR